ncbi:MAG: BolA family transcriptional regulator [Bdellovibrionales bacterium]|nr:BolA family transcriptional regulator [Bdellovibrionales bacterium]
MNVVQTRIEEKLKSLSVSHLQVINESHMHSVPENSETHFKVILVSDEFNDKPRIQRHRLINQLLQEELSGPVHALSLKLYTPDEWETHNPNSLKSPDCHGGSKLG